MIVKVQISIITGGEKKQVLIYNKDKRYLWQGDASEEVLKVMNGEYKKYFNAKLVDTKFELSYEVPAQNW